jgi:oligopeptide transport system permease protein
MSDTPSHDDPVRTRRDAESPAAERAVAVGTQLGPSRGTPGDPGVEESLESSAVAGAGGELRQTSLWGDVWRQLRRNPLFLLGGTIISVLAVMAVFPGLFTDTDPRSCSLARSRENPSSEAFFGYDVLGCDYYANVIYGARVSMAIGLLVVGGALAIGIALGALAGYAGGWVDNALARTTDIVYGLPFILGAILILNAFTNRGLLQVSIALILLAWMTPLRLVRSSVIGIKDSDYVQAARALGASPWTVVTRHILPNALAPVLVYGTILVGVVIAAEATLSFLGVGLQLPAISWGLQINVAQQFIRTSPSLLFFPSAFLSVTVLAFIMIGDALRDALDPKLR